MKEATNSPLAKQLSDALKEKIGERRDPLLISLIMYLCNPDSLKSIHPMKLAAKAAVVRLGNEMMRRLFEDNAEINPIAGASQNYKLAAALEFI